jgi:uncharacterized protein (DUF1015 family)
MTQVRPFRALRYDSARVDLSNVIVPPYDVIAGDERSAFFDRDPYNAIRFELTREVESEADTDYSELAGTLASWQQEGVLRPDDVEALYVLRQRFEAPDGRALERLGFFAELGLCEYEERVVRPHENTLAGPKADRLKLLRAAQANLSSVFMLYEDRQQALASLLESALDRNVLAEAKDDSGVEYTLAAMTQRDQIAEVQAFLAERPVVIADGHHRYETALAYRSEMRVRNPGIEAAPWESTLAYFANLYAPGSLLLPIHRVVRSDRALGRAVLCEKLSGWQQKSYAIESEDGSDVPALLDAHLAPHSDSAAFAVDDGTGDLRVFWRDEPLGDELMVRILEREVLEGVFGIDAEQVREGAVRFPKSAQRAAREVREEQGAVALYLNALHPDDVFRTTEAGERMPQKSTFFWPKVPTGLVFRLHGRLGQAQ